MKTFQIIRVVQNVFQCIMSLLSNSFFTMSFGFYNEFWTQFEYITAFQKLLTSNNIVICALEEDEPFWLMIVVRPTYKLCSYQLACSKSQDSSN